jgi:guanylate kinase
MARAILVCGPTGVGKSTLIRAVLPLVSSLRYVRPHITRPLRTGETEKIAVDQATFNQMAAKAEFVLVNTLYGASYGTSRSEIASILALGLTPIVDWPIDRVEAFRKATGLTTFVLYVAPRSWKSLLERGGARLTQERLEIARGEWKQFREDRLPWQPDCVLVADRSVAELAKQVIHNLPEGVVP